MNVCTSHIAEPDIRQYVINNRIEICHQRSIQGGLVAPIDTSIFLNYPNVFDSLKNLPNCLGSIFLCKSSLFADSIKKLSSGCQLGNNVVLVLINVSR